MTRTSFLAQTVVSVLSLNGVVHAMDSEADWAFAANHLAKRAIAIPSPIQKGQPANCILWKYVESTDNCNTIVKMHKENGLTGAKFLELNPALGNDCGNLKKNFYVCVQTGTAAGAAKTPAAKTTATTAKTTATTSAKETKTTATTSAKETKTTATTSAKETESTATTSAEETETTATTSAKETETTATTSAKETKTAAPAEPPAEEEETEDEDDRHADNPPAVKLTTKNPEAPTKLEENEDDQYVVLGAGDTNLSPRFCAPRRNIVNLQKELPDTFNLLVLALDKMMKTPDTDALSYFQMSGVHGAPFISWPKPGEKGNSGLGYCSHNSVIFATWHRPYIMAYEQALYRHARDIVRRLFTKPEVQKKYIAALQQLRWPYWDWADRINQSNMPKVTMDAKITVMGPDGQGGERKVTIANPFYSYVFKGPENTIFKKGFIGLNATSRRPEISSSSVSVNEAADNAMQSNYITRRKQTYNALTSTTTFNYFANSLEKLHNDVHMQVGGNGIMGVIPYAAFDPVFWLHHNNIDRMLAIWQAANPGKYLTPDTAVPSFMRAVSPDDKDDLNTPLYPWKHPNGKWWTSNDVKDVTTIWSYGYGYPEVPCYFQGDTNTLDDFATEAINNAYSDTNTPKIKGRAAVKQATTAGQNVTEWDINIIVDQAELYSTFSIYVFLGNPPADPKKWDMSSQKVSTMTLLGNPDVPKMSKLEGMTIPLGPLLSQKGVKGTEKEIQDYLAKYLVWTCLSVTEEGGTKPYDVKLMKSLKVAVTSRSVIMPTNMKAKPRVGKAKIQTAATKDKAKSGGASTLAELAHTKLKGGAEAHLRQDVLPDIQNTTVTGGKF
ncbi:uncharacterized protein DFL_000501 [Arthrobotrys flagrans]|uniref:tyrosinase n=1 Tax=Arthrobotrys flagrans TaxID=97331 RepID=A0A437AF91_ARTFL|nr:hypothetical protein DFL_000501 [Arthrobotrys flagrans]